MKLPMWFFKNYGILGQNARNLHYIGEYNDDLAKRLADSKLKTKEFLSNKGVRVSESIAVLKTHKELDNFDLTSLPLPFVVKPNAGYGGKGIIVFETKDADGNYISNDHQVYTLLALKHHISDILDGFYSLSGSRDKVIFERKIILDHSIDLLGKYGLPDMRVIVFNSIPVIAMLRVPTANSKGKANLHMGACGLGVDIGSGKITYITQFKKMIKSIPGIGDVRGIEIPQWEEILKLAVKVQQVTGVGYVGCDIVLDDTYGPLLLEMNVRPGLEVQVANKVPLLERLKKVQNIKVNSVEKGVRLARDLFGGDIEEKIKNISGKKVVGNREYIEIIHNDKASKTICETKANKPNSYISSDYLQNTIGYPLDKVKNNLVKLKISLLGEVRTIRFHVKELENSNVILGKEALYGFLIDPFKYKENALPMDLKNPIIKEKNTVILKSYEEQLLRIDKELMDIDKKLHILKIITPKNITSERLKFVESKGQYIPKLEYNEVNIDIKKLFETVNEIEIPDIPLSGIYKRKKEEIIDKLYFIKAFKEQNVKDLNYYNKKLFGGITKENYAYAKNLLQDKPVGILPDEFMTLEEIRVEIDKFNHIYSIDIDFKEKEIVSRFQIVGDTLYIKNGSKVGKKDIRPVIAHEIEGHYLRRYNGLKQKLSLFSKGTARYLTTEEGLATYNQNKFLTQNDEKYYYNAGRYFFIGYALENPYVDLVAELVTYYHGDYEAVFRSLLRLKRGIKNVESDYVFVKDCVYLNGYLEVDEYIKNGGNIYDLYFGKICISDLDEMKKSELLDMKQKDLKIPLFYN